MKRILIIHLLAALVLGCTKISHSGSATINVVNAIDSNNFLITSFVASGAKGTSVAPLQYFASASRVYYGSSWETGAFTGPVSLSLYQDVDTTVALWSGTFDLSVGSIH